MQHVPLKANFDRDHEISHLEIPSHGRIDLSNPGNSILYDLVAREIFLADLVHNIFVKPADSRGARKRDPESMEFQRLAEMRVLSCDEQPSVACASCCAL